MFAIELEFLTGRYVASRYNDRSRAEWPPHPARLFSALVATYSAGENRPQAEREALLWLERQGAPLLRASPPDEVAERDPYTAFVPVNDPDVVGTFDSEHEELERARAAASADKMAAARVRTLEKRLDDRITRAVAEGKVSAEGMKTAQSILPETRLRQPRGFPSVTPADARVYFIWPEALPDGAIRAALETLTSNLVRLGHSSSLVRARVVDSPPEANWRPDEAGSHRLRVVGEGQLAALDDAFELHRETQPRVLPALFERYSCGAATTEESIPRSVFGREWLVLRRTGGPFVPAAASAAVARSVRSALLRFASQPPPELLTGHDQDGGPAQRPHLAIVPLPFVGHFRADGSILGVALVFPREVSQADRRAVFRAVATWEAANRKDGDEAPAVPVFLGAAGELYLSRVDEVAHQATLRPSTWCGPSRRWVTATPVALDRHPGDLRDRNPDRAAKAASEAEETLRASVAHLGLPPPTEVRVLSAAPLAGAAKAKHFAPFPAEPTRARRALVHAAITFERDVEGPLLLGAGRYLGLGLFRPVTADD